jgi:hypothetical protein
MTTTISLGPKADCVYGRTGSTKTSQVGHLAEYIWEKYHKQTRLVSADPGGWQPVEHLVEAGIIAKPYHMTFDNKFPLEDLVHLALGWWPDDTGKLKAPGPGSFDNIGAYAFEGMTSFSTLIMTNLVKRQDISIPGTPKESFVKDDTMRWGFSGQSHYGFIQQRIYEVVVHSNHLPVHKVLWTAHEGTGKDKNRAIYGPKVTGEAMTGENGAWFGAMLHLMQVDQQVEVADPIHAGKKMLINRRVPLMFLREHIDPGDAYKVPYIAKPRGPSNMWEQWPDWIKPNIGDFYRKLDEMGEKALAEVRARVAKVTI